MTLKVTDPIARAEQVQRERQIAERDAIARIIAERDAREREIVELRAQQPAIEAERREAATEHDEYLRTCVAPARATLAKLEREAASRAQRVAELAAEALCVRDRLAQLARELERYDRDANGRLTPESLARALSRLHRDNGSHTLYCGVRVAGDLRALNEIAIDETRVPGAELRAWRERVLAAIA
jgi:hypothetical protein